MVLATGKDRDAAGEGAMVLSYFDKWLASVPKGMPTGLKDQFHLRGLVPQIHVGFKPCEFPMVLPVLPVPLTLQSHRWGSMLMAFPEEKQHKLTLLPL